ncbi:MAG: RNA-binding S4 domain-containing protein [Pseudomonadota bacterium]
MRLDKWLWHARFFKTRSLAARVISEHGVRVNGARVSKPARAVGTGDTLTFLQARQVRVVRILELGKRRGPAPEAATLYEDLSPPAPKPPHGAPAFEGKGKPSRKERRNARDSWSDSLE